MKQGFEFLFELPEQDAFSAQLTQARVAAQAARDKEFAVYVLNDLSKAGDMIGYFYDFLLQHPTDWRFYLIDDIDECGTYEGCILMGYEDAMKLFEKRQKRINKIGNVLGS